MITVGPNATVREIAYILLTNRISAVPVVDEQGAVIEIVSEGTSFTVEAVQSTMIVVAQSPSDKSALAHDFLKSHAVRAA